MATTETTAIAEDFLDSFFQAVSRAVGFPLLYQVQSPQLASPRLSAWIDAAPLLVRPRKADAAGGIALLLTFPSAAQIATGNAGASAILTGEGRASLEGIMQDAFEAGLQAIGSKADAIALEELSADGASPLLAWLGGGATGIPLRFRGEGAGPQGDMVLLLDNAVADATISAAAWPSLNAQDYQHLPREPSAPAAPNVTTTQRNLERESMDMILDINLVATARLGRVEMPIAEILRLGPGSLIDVGHLVDEPVDLLVNDKLVARGDVVVVNDKFGLRITEIISPRERIETLG